MNILLHYCALAPPSAPLLGGSHCHLGSHEGVQMHHLDDHVIVNACRSAPLLKVCNFSKGTRLLKPTEHWAPSACWKALQFESHEEKKTQTN